jgi:hypothetical protein
LLSYTNYSHCQVIEKLNCREGRESEEQPERSATVTGQVKRSELLLKDEREEVGRFEEYLKHPRKRLNSEWFSSNYRKKPGRKESDKKTPISFDQEST